MQYTINSLSKSQTYAFRYRAKNAYGWGGYSPVSYILIAVVPGQAKAPVLVSATSTSVTVSLDLNVDNGGSQILSYSLQISSDGVNYSIVSSYDGISPMWTLT